jgi:CDP-glucose 4,6-dehydratase
MFGGAYSGRRILVTGHTGFKGSWLSYWLTRLGANVAGYALEPPTRPSLFVRAGLESLVEHTIADVRDEGRLQAALTTTRPEVVFHLAAQPLVREGYAAPRTTFDTNVMGTVNLLEAVRHCDSVAAVVIVTSDKCYRNLEDGRPFAEDDPLGGLDPYSASKGCAELVTAAYAASFFAAGPVAVASARAGNVIGGGDWAADRLVPDCVRALEAGAPVIVRRPEAVRPWQHVLEALAGYLTLGAALLADGPAFAGAWNFGPAGAGDTLPVRWVVDSFIEEWGGGEWTTPVAGPDGPGEAHRLNLDSGKARARLAWTPLWDAPTAVKHTAAWYRRCGNDPTSAQGLVEQDVRAYVAGAVQSGYAWAGNGWES